MRAVTVGVRLGIGLGLGLGSGWPWSPSRRGRTDPDGASLEPPGPPPEALGSGVLERGAAAVARFRPDRDAEAALRHAIGAARLLLGADTAGLLLTDGDGGLRWAVGLDGRDRAATRAHERFRQGPCMEAFELARPVAVADAGRDARWAALLGDLPATGVGATLSVPVCLDGEPVGVLGLLCAVPRSWDAGRVAAAEAYAGVLGLLLGAAAAAAGAGELAGQLQHALTTRIRIEQAKGILMAREGIDAQSAWQRLRGHARAAGRSAHAVAEELLASVEPLAVAPGRADDGPPRGGSGGG